LSATLSGGAWSADVPDQLINTDYTLVNLEDNINFQGDNTVIYTLTDPNADTFSADNTIVLRYTPDIYIVGVDDNTNVTDPVETSEYQVDLTYVLGGVFTTSAGLDWTGGTSATEPAVALSPGDNELIVGPYPDDFGNTESSYPLTVTKVPDLVYTGLTTIDQETYGISYTATSGLEIDTGAPYATAIDAQFTFTSGDYRTYDFDLSYGYPSQPSASATTSVSIDYVPVEITNIVLEATTNYTFGTPRVSPDSVRSIRVSGTDSFVETVEDVNSSESFVQTVEANQYKVVQNEFGFGGMQCFDISESRMEKPRTGNEAWDQDEFTIVFEGVASESESGEDTLLYMGFNDRPLMFDTSEHPYFRSSSTSVGPDGSAYIAGEIFSIAVIGNVTSGTLRLRDNKGGDVQDTGFTGWGGDATTLIGFIAGLDRRFCGIYHRIYGLPYVADDDQWTRIQAQTLNDFWLEPPIVGTENSLTEDGYPVYLEDGNEEVLTID
jgi:hypothetical protein